LGQKTFDEYTYLHISLKSTSLLRYIIKIIKYDKFANLQSFCYFLMNHSNITNKLTLNDYNSSCAVNNHSKGQ
jgi:hypothetical protein